MAKWRYKLKEDYERDLPEWWQDRIVMNHESMWFKLNQAPPKLLIKAGYSWDGCSGPFIHDGACRVAGPGMPVVAHKPGDCFRTTTRGSMTHDIGYQFLELFEVLGVSRRMWDDLFKSDVKEDGFGAYALYHWGVRKLGGIWHLGRKILKRVGLIK